MLTLSRFCLKQEACFANLLEGFLARASARKAVILECAELTNGNVSQLAVAFGEPPDSDPAALFGLLTAFVAAFDRAVAAVARKNLKAEV